MPTSDDLFATIAAGDTERLTTLLAEQPSLVNTRSAEGVTPILWAYYTGRSHLVPALLTADPQLDVHDAAALGDVSHLCILLNGTPSLAQAYSPDGFTALHYVAFFSGSADAAACLLDAGAEIDAVARNRQRVTPLHSAAAGGYDAVIRLLVERGAAVNARQAGGETPLMGVAQNGSVEQVDYLLHHGADASLTTDDGKTAADFAAEAGHALLATKLRGLGNEHNLNAQ